MRFSVLSTTAALLAAKAGAAPKNPEDQVLAHGNVGLGFQPNAGPGRRGLHRSNITSTAPPGTAVSTIRNITSTARSSHICSLSIITSTTVVDVTFYITATTSYGSNVTSLGTGTSHPLLSASSSQLSSSISRTTHNTSASARFSTVPSKPTNITSTLNPVTSVVDSKTPCLGQNSTTTTTTGLQQANMTTSVSSSGHSNSTIPPETSSMYSTGPPTTPSSTSSWLSRTESGDDLSATSKSRPIKPSSHLAHESATNCQNEISTMSSSGIDADSEVGDRTSTSSYDSHASATSTLEHQTSHETPNHTTATLPSYTGGTASAPGTASVGVTTSSRETTTSTAEGYLSNSTAALTETSASCDPSSFSSSSGPSTSLPSRTLSFYTTVDQQTTAASSRTPTAEESCVIDTSMVPVTSAALTSPPSSTVVPTKTLCQDDAPTGKPGPGANHCGVHGLPVGNYFLARFVENSPGRRVTLEGCFQFCASVMNATDGCKSYRFYPERGLNVPRCDLYGSDVAYALNSINNDHPDIWFDLACGSPSDEQWFHLQGMNRLRDLGLLA